MQFVDLEPGDVRLTGDVFPVLAELRTELTAEALESVYAEGYPQGLRFTAALLPRADGDHRSEFHHRTRVGRHEWSRSRR